MNTDRLLSIPAEEYHAASRSGMYMSSHLLADFRESPELYRRKTSGEIAEAESPALALGRAAHCLILEGRDAFDGQYLVADGGRGARQGHPRPGEGRRARPQLRQPDHASGDARPRHRRESHRVEGTAIGAKHLSGKEEHPAPLERTTSGVPRGVETTP